MNLRFSWTRDTIAHFRCNWCGDLHTIVHDRQAVFAWHPFQPRIELCVALLGFNSILCLHGCATGVPSLLSELSRIDARSASILAGIVEVARSCITVMQSFCRSGYGGKKQESLSRARCPMVRFGSAPVFNDVTSECTAMPQHKSHRAIWIGVLAEKNMNMFFS